MSPSRRWMLRAGAGAAGFALAGCADQPTATTTTPEPDPFPPGTVSLPDGPKSAPERPANLTDGAVREYVRDYERAYVYNTLHREEATGTRASCSILEVVRVGGGFAVGVRCTGTAEYVGGTTTAHADFIGQPLTYLVDGNSTFRRAGEPADHVTTTTGGPTTTDETTTTTD